MIRNTQQACDVSGMPLAHATCFQQVADNVNCVIASRSVGKFATGLILENYASKGFHVKAKSCNWGPMAGFVLSDPRFTKRGMSRTALEKQRKDIQNAMRGGATVTQVFLSNQRKTYIENLPSVVELNHTINTYEYRATSPDGGNVRFVLERQMNAPGTANQMWGLYYANGERPMPADLTAPVAAANNLFPVMALVDPLCDRNVFGTYRAAMTGDYDLWGVLPPVAGNDRYDPQGDDRRPVPGANRFVLPIRDFIRHEDPHMGNITPRMADIKNRLNNRIRAAGYTGGNMVHHSDEAGRPMVDEVEMDFIAFIPNQAQARYVANMQDFFEFQREVLRGYQLMINPGWGRQLGIGATPGGSWEV